MDKKRSVSPGGLSALAVRIRKEMKAIELDVGRRLAMGYWRIGRWISVELLKNKDRAGYGEHLYEEVAQRVSFSPTTLKRTVQFYRTYPIRSQVSELSWSHFLHLMAVKDKGQRKKLEHQALVEGWSVPELKKRIVAEASKASAADSKEEKESDKEISRLTLVRGRLNIYKVLASKLRGKDGGELLIDYGFGVRRPFPEGEKKGFKDGDLLECSGGSDDPSGRYVKTDVEDKLRYTYKAYVERVVDGDTLLVLIEGGGGNLVKERLRLRGINCAELKTESGQRAKRFVEGKLKDLPFIIIRTYKEQVDIHARYVADVFYLPREDHRGLPGETDEAAVSEKGNFLNQELLDAKMAVPY